MVPAIQRIFGTAVFNDRRSSQFANASAALTFVSGAAVMIERVTEMFWTVLGGLIGTFWPLNPVARQVQAMAQDLDNALTPFQADLDKVAAAKSWSVAQIAAAKKEIDDLEKCFDEMKQYPPSNQRFQLLIAAAAQNVEYLQQKYGQALPHLQEAKAVADQAINSLQDFLASFKDNPGRRLISIYFGCLLGLVVAGLYHLDAYAAALGTASHRTISVVLTGLLMELGANPTHEVIRAI